MASKMFMVTLSLSLIFGITKEGLAFDGNRKGFIIGSFEFECHYFFVIKSASDKLFTISLTASRSELTANSNFRLLVFRPGIAVFSFF